jgi:hypothetical protein
MTRSGNSRRTGLDRKSFEAIAETIPHIVWLADASGSTDYFNVMGTDYTGSRGEPTTRIAPRCAMVRKTWIAVWRNSERRRREQ